MEAHGDRVRNRVQQNLHPVKGENFTTDFTDGHGSGSEGILDLSVFIRAISGQKNVTYNFPFEW
jgi:hypothetical protein